MINEELNQEVTEDRQLYLQGGCPAPVRGVPAELGALLKQYGGLSLLIAFWFIRGVWLSSSLAATTITLQAFRLRMYLFNSFLNRRKSKKKPQ